MSLEFAKKFFKQKSGESNNTIGSEQIDVNKAITLTTSDKGEVQEIEFKEKKSREEESKGDDGQKDKEVILYPRIEMIVMNSRANEQGHDKIIITPNSINGVMKKLGDKFAFGRNSGLNSLPNSLLGSLPSFVGKMNDYNFLDESIGPRQFEISYSIEKGKFFIVDNKRGTGLFVKIKQKVVVDHDMIVSFCASHMILQEEPEVYHPENKIIKIKFLQGPHQNQERTFNSKDKKIIRIGRSKQAEVIYKDDSVSRIQCTIVFEKGEWNIYDGYLDNGNKGSTNGLWYYYHYDFYRLLASNKLEMSDDMILKTGNTTLQIKLYESEEEFISGGNN